MRNTSRELMMIFEGVKSWFFYAYLFVLVLCFLLFQQGDLAHTTASSYAYLNGHFSDFYEYNKKYMGRNDYLPLLYIIFAIWNIPLYLFGSLSSPELWQQLSPIELAWAKLLPVIFFFASAMVLAKISKLIADGDGGVPSSAAVIFATAPIAIFAVFIFSQYDIIGVFFTLLGFYFYLKKDLLRFACFFSVAISFKYFALIIYVPLILMAEKNCINIVRLMLIGIFVTAAEYAIYSQSKVFQAKIFSLALTKITESSTDNAGWSFSNPKLYLAALYLLGCCYVYFKKFNIESEWKKTAVLVPIVAYGLMFAAVRWHPQWLIIVMPFFALAYTYIKNRTLLAYLDLLGMLAFVWMIVNIFPYNVDVTMIKHGVLKDYIPQPPLIISDFMKQDAFSIFQSIFNVYLFLPVLVILLQSFSKQRAASKKLSERLVFIRFFAGVSCFLLPALLCTYIPYPLIFKINQNAYLNSYKRVVIAAPGEKTIGEISGKNRAIQTFKANLNGLAAIMVQLANNARLNNGSIQLIIEDAEGHKLAENSIPTVEIVDNVYSKFIFDPILDSKGKIYRLVIQADPPYPGNAITAWTSKTNVYAEGELKFAGKTTGKDLAMRIYFDPRAK